MKKDEREIIDEEDIDYLEIELKKAGEKKKQPVDNKKLYQEFLPYIAACDEVKAYNAANPDNPKRLPRLPESIGAAIIKIAHMTTFINTSTCNFIRYTNNWKEEMEGDAIEICCRYVHNFNPEKSKNPFSYIQTLCIRTFLQRLKKEHQQLYYRYKLYQKANGFVGEVNDTVSEADLADIQTHYADDAANDFIKRFEDKRKKEKIKYKKRKEEKNKPKNSLGKFMKDND